MRERFLLALYRLARRGAWLVLAGALVLAVPAALSLTDLKVDSTLQGLLPADDPVLGRFEQYQSTLRGTERTTVLLRLTSPPAAPGEGVDRLLEAGRRLEEALDGHEEIVSVSYRREGSRTAVLPIDLTALSEETLKELKAKILELEGLVEGRTPLEGGERPLDETYAEITRALSRLLSGLAVLSPERLAETLQELGGDLERLGSLNGAVREALTQVPQELERADAEIGRFGERLDALKSALQPTPKGDSYLLSKDKSALLVNVFPRRPSTESVEYNRRILGLIQGELAALGLQDQGIEWGIKGPYAFSVYSDDLLRRDMNRTAVVTVVGVFLLFVIVLRRFFYPLLATVPVLLALLFVLAFAKGAFGELNLLTAFVPAIVLGLGIDYGIQFLSHYLEERGGSRRVVPALRRTLLDKGSAMIVAALATSTVLFALGAVARSPGLGEMGTVLGLGVLLSCLLTLLLLPAMTVSGHGILRRRARGHPPHLWNLSALARFIARRRRAVIGLVLAGTLAMAWPASRMEFTFISEALMPTDLPSQRTSAYIDQNFDLQGEIADPENFFLFFVEPEEERVREVTEALYRLEAIDRRPTSYYSYIPFSDPAKREALKRQLTELKALAPLAPLGALDRRLQALGETFGRREALQGALTDLSEELAAGEEQILTSTGDEALAEKFASLRDATLAIRERLEALGEAKVEDRIFVLQEKVAALAQRVSSLLGQIPAPEEVDRLIENPPSEIREAFFTSDGRAIIFAHLNSKWLWNSDLYDRFVREASQIADRYLGQPMIRARVQYYAERDFGWSTALALLIIVAILYFNFRRSRVRGGTWLSLVTLGLGYLWMLGTLRMLGIEFNVANILVSPLLIGLGVDNCVYLIYRHHDLDGRSVERATASTALPIIANTLATMIGFGSLLLAETPVLRLLGESAVVGIGFMILFGLTFLPAALAFRR